MSKYCMHRSVLLCIWLVEKELSKLPYLISQFQPSEKPVVEKEPILYFPVKCSLLSNKFLSAQRQLWPRSWYIPKRGMSVGPEQDWRADPPQHSLRMPPAKSEGLSAKMACKRRRNEDPVSLVPSRESALNISFGSGWIISEFVGLDLAWKGRFLGKVVLLTCFLIYLCWLYLSKVF